jgi:hypothetical protein
MIFSSFTNCIESVFCCSSYYFCLCTSHLPISVSFSFIYTLTNDQKIALRGFISQVCSTSHIPQSVIEADIPAGLALRAGFCFHLSRTFHSLDEFYTFKRTQSFDFSKLVKIGALKEQLHERYHRWRTILDLHYIRQSSTTDQDLELVRHVRTTLIDSEVLQRLR